MKSFAELEKEREEMGKPEYPPMPMTSFCGAILGSAEAYKSLQKSTANLPPSAELALAEQLENKVKSNKRILK